MATTLHFRWRCLPVTPPPFRTASPPQKNPPPPPPPEEKNPLPRSGQCKYPSAATYDREVSNNAWPRLSSIVDDCPDSHMSRRHHQIKRSPSTSVVQQCCRGSDAARADGPAPNPLGCPAVIHHRVDIGRSQSHPAMLSRGGGHGAAFTAAASCHASARGGWGRGLRPWMGCAALVLAPH